jgi:hypothetical protein
MAIKGSLSLTLSLQSDTASSPMVLPVSGLSYSGTNESYSQSLTVGTSPVSVTLPSSPANLVYVRNLAPAGLAAPAAPSLSSVTGGALSGATYYVKIGVVNASGEVVSTEASIVISASHLPVVAAPTQPVGATGWNVYIASSTGAETKQNTSLLPFGASFTLPTTGLISGGAVPSGNTTAPVVTVTWTPQGGTSAQAIDLWPQGVIVFCEPTSTNGYNAASGKGGITALTVQSSQASTPVEVITVE